MKLYNHFEIIDKLTELENYVEINCIGGFCFNIKTRECEFIHCLKKMDLICIVTDQCSMGKSYELYLKLDRRGYENIGGKRLLLDKNLSFGKLAPGFIKIWERK